MFLYIIVVSAAIICNITALADVDDKYVFASVEQRDVPTVFTSCHLLNENSYSQIECIRSCSKEDISCKGIAYNTISNECFKCTLSSGITSDAAGDRPSQLPLQYYAAGNTLRLFNARKIIKTLNHIMFIYRDV